MTTSAASRHCSPLAAINYTDFMPYATLTLYKK